MPDVLSGAVLAAVLESLLKERKVVCWRFYFLHPLSESRRPVTPEVLKDKCEYTLQVRFYGLPQKIQPSFLDALRGAAFSTLVQDPGVSVHFGFECIGDKEQVLVSLFENHALDVGMVSYPGGGPSSVKMGSSLRQWFCTTGNNLYRDHVYRI